MSKTLIQIVSVAAFNPEGKLLMGKRQDCGRWTCPGGHIDEGEKPARAAVRELLEEAGLRPGTGGLEYMGSKVVRDRIEVHSFKTTGVSGKPTGENDPDQECRVWKWVDVEDGLPEEQAQNLYNSQDVTLQLLGFQDGPVRKFQIPPPLGERLAKVELQEQRPDWRKAVTEPFLLDRHTSFAGIEAAPGIWMIRHQRKGVGPVTWVMSPVDSKTALERGQSHIPVMASISSYHRDHPSDQSFEVASFASHPDHPTAGPFLLKWVAQKHGVVRSDYGTTVSPGLDDMARKIAANPRLGERMGLQVKLGNPGDKSQHEVRPLEKAQKPAPESMVMADQLMEQGFQPTKGFTNKQGLGTNRNRVAIKDPWPEDQKRIASGPGYTNANYHPAAARYEARTNLMEATWAAQGENIAENVNRRNANSPLAGPLDLHPWTRRVAGQEEVYWQNPGAQADDVTSIRFTDEGLLAHSNTGPGVFYHQTHPRFQELIQRSRIPPEVVAEHMRQALKKGWPRDEAENQANATAPMVLEDHLLELGAEKKVVTPPPNTVPPVPGMPALNMAWGNRPEGGDYVDRLAHLQAENEGLDNAVTSNWALNDAQEREGAPATMPASPSRGTVANWEDGPEDKRLDRAFWRDMGRWVGLHKSEALRKTEESQALERLRATRLVALAAPLEELSYLARKPTFVDEAQAQARVQEAQRQIQELSQDIDPPPTPRELAILEARSSSAQLLALQSPATTRADRELVLQRLTRHAPAENHGDDELLKHLNRTLDQDQRLWLASQIGTNGRARWVMGAMMQQEPSRWKLPERAVAADQALQLLRSPDFNSQLRGSAIRDMVVSQHAPTPLAPEQIQAFLELDAPDALEPEQKRQLAGHPDLPPGYLRQRVDAALELQKARFRAMAADQDVYYLPHAEADSFLANPQVPDDVLHEYARQEIRNYNPQYGLPTSVTSLPKHRPEMVDRLAPDLYENHWQDKFATEGTLSGTPGGILREAYLRADNGYATQPMPESLQRLIAEKGVGDERLELPPFAYMALQRPEFRPEFREMLLTPEKIQEAGEYPNGYIDQVMASNATGATTPEHDQWLEKMQVHPDARVQHFAIWNAKTFNPGLADLIRKDPHENGQTILQAITNRSAPVPEPILQAMADLVPQSKAAQEALYGQAILGPQSRVRAEHLQPLLDLQDQTRADTVLRHETLSLPQITGDQLFRVLTGPDAHRWSSALKTPETSHLEIPPGVESALAVHGHKLSPEQQRQLVDSPLTYVAHHAARNLPPEDMDALLARSQRIAHLQGLLANKGVKPEHLQEIASRPGLASMLTLAAQEPHARPEILDQVYEYRDRILAQGGDVDDLVLPLAKHPNASPQLLRSLDQDLRAVLTHGGGADAAPWMRKLNEQAVLRGPQLLQALMQNPAMPMDRAVDLGEWIQNLHPKVMPQDWKTRPPPHPAFKRMWETQSPDREEGWDQHAAWTRYMDRGKKPEWQHLTKLATDLVSELHPDSRFKTRVKIRPGVERLREIRDLILERNPEGKELSPKQLPPGDWSMGRLPNGNIGADRLQAHMDSLPGQEFNLSRTHWAKDLQRHNAFPSKVLQVNLTTDMVQKLKHARVWPTFKAMTEASRVSSHPVNEHTLGWVRFTGTPEHGFFIDEIQSDLGQSFVRQAKAQAQARGLDGEEAARRAEAKYPEAHFQKIQELVFAGRHPNQVLHEAFLQHLRDQGHVGVPVHMHTPETKAPISGMSKGKALPGHMLQTYGEQPRKMGYRPVTYGSITATASQGPSLAASDYDQFLPGAAHTNGQPLDIDDAQGLIHDAQVTVDYRPAAALPGATVQGTKIRKFEDRAKIWLLTRAMPLAKMAINPKDLSSVGRATNASLGQAQVDDSLEHQAHPPVHEHVAQAFRSQVVDSPKIIRRGQAGLSESSNATAKSVFDLHGVHLEGLGDKHRFMVKPYHEVVSRYARHWMHVPIQGWAEMTNQHLYHAANIGDLHQRVHVQRVPFQKGKELQHGPTLVIHMEPGATTVDRHGDTPGAYSQQQQQQGRKIAVLDFLSNNLDRHTTNLLVLPQKDQLLAVDHSRSFQYKVGDKMGDGPLNHDQDCMRQYIGYWQDGWPMGSGGLSSVLAHTVEEPLQVPPEMEALKRKGWAGGGDPVPGQHNQQQPVFTAGDGDLMTKEAINARREYLQWHQKALEKLGHLGREQWSRAWDPTFKWFADNAEPVRKAFESRLKLLKDERIREHLRQNFMARFDHLLDLAKHGTENFGIDDWDLHPVSIFPLRRK